MTTGTGIAAVGLTYCNGTEFLHEHDLPIDAIEEYARVLAEVLDPAGDNDDKVHLRQVSLTVIDNRRGGTHVIDSGVFTCEHRA